MARFGSFGTYVCQGDRQVISHGSCKITATIQHDDWQRVPWQEFDCHGPVSEWTLRGKKPGERVLSVNGSSRRYYDVAAAMEKAKAEGWSYKDAPDDATPGQKAAGAVEQDFKVLKAWCDDEWCYVGVVVTLEFDEVELASHALWGIEANVPGGDNSYLTEVANELLMQVLEVAEIRRMELAEALTALTITREYQ